MSLNAVEIGLVVLSLKKDLQDAVVRKVMSAEEPNQVVLELRTPGKNHYLQIVGQAGMTRIGRLGTKPKTAQSPHPFVMLLRREMSGLLLQDVRQLGADRVVELCFEAGDRKGSLVCELTSRHANLFWIDLEGLISGSLVPNRSHRRRLVPGYPYVPPAPHADSRTRESRFDAGPQAEEQIEQFYRVRESERQLDADRAFSKRLVNSALKRVRTLAGRLEQDRERAAKAEALTNYGHLLKANLKTCPKGAAEVELVDFEGKSVKIPLDPSLSPVANMQRLFDKAKRLRRAGPFIDERAQKNRSDLEHLEALAEQLETTDSDRLLDICDGLKERFPYLADKVPNSKKASTPERLPYKQFAIATGRPARVGRSAADNDTLTLRFAKPDDLWLHVKGRPGSHVVVPLGRGEDPTPDLLVDAAHLAAHFSTAKKESDVEIIYTRRRYVQKPKGAPAGSVRLLKEKTIMLRVEEKRLARLLGAK